ncbi:MAG: hypothetical protein KJ077_06325 [Anaerolineae bacterium]|nr:hypothetical protein [Anaerolineae bacterium]
MNLTQPTAPPIVVDLHGLKLAFQSPDLPLRERFEEVYGHLPRLNGAGSDVFIGWHIHKLPSAPPPPPGMPVISEGPLVGYYGQGHLVAIRMPKYGLITVDLDQQRLVGAVTRNTLEAYGAFEDVLLISLAPLYRRRGWFPLHAFASLAPTGKAALISGQMGAGKTTTGLALLNAGWKLLSNDSPLLRLRTDGQVEALAYPGRLSAFDDSLARFEGLRRFIPVEAEAKAEAEVIDLLAPAGPQKRVFRAEEAFAEPWAASGVAGGIFFPQVIPGLGQSELVEVSPKEAVLQLMPQAIEGWDKAAIGQTLYLLGKLVEQAPCYQLRLSPRVEQLPALIARGM